MASIPFPAGGNLVANQTYTINNLTANSTYNFFIRSDRPVKVLISTAEVATESNTLAKGDLYNRLFGVKNGSSTTVYLTVTGYAGAVLNATYTVAPSTAAEALPATGLMVPEKLYSVTATVGTPMAISLTSDASTSLDVGAQLTNNVAFLTNLTASRGMVAVVPPATTILLMAHGSSKKIVVSTASNANIKTEFPSNVIEKVTLA